MNLWNRAAFLHEDNLLIHQTWQTWQPPHKAACNEVSVVRLLISSVPECPRFVVPSAPELLVPPESSIVDVCDSLHLQDQEFYFEYFEYLLIIINNDLYYILYYFLQFTLP